MDWSESTLPESLYDQYELKIGGERKPRPPSRRPAQKNRRMVFLHSSPRSGSTLLRVMLAGHPDLFCPPELDILPFERMGE